MTIFVPSFSQLLSAAPEISKSAEDANPFLEGLRSGCVDVTIRRVWKLGDLCIKTKDKRLVAFTPNEVQASFLDLIIPLWRDGAVTMRGFRHLILKARQFGFSTLIAVLFFLDTLITPNTGTVIVSYDRESSEKLFEMVDRMYRNIPVNQRPRTQRANARELYWPDIDCHYEVLTAGSKSLGRSWTINNLHVSELAFWAHADVLGGLLQSVPAEGNVFIESTANGEGAATYDNDGELVIEGSAFHVYYEQAKAKESEYVAHFFAWYQHPEYRMEPSQEFTRTNAADEENDPRLFARYGNEERLAELYSLDDWQLYWRRLKIDSPNMGPAKFAQEYPANDTEAFRTSGKKFFAGLWDPEIHVREMEIQSWWKPLGGQDWGYGVPWCFLLGWTFPAPGGGTGIYVSDECYGARMRNKEQAAAIVKVLTDRGLGLRDAIIFADPAMWGKEGAHQADNIGRANVEDFWDAGLSLVKANNDRVDGCSNMREYMAAPGALVVSPRCENTIRTLPLVLHDPHDLEVYEKSQEREQHAIDTLRYLLNSRPRAPHKPAGDKLIVPPWMQSPNLLAKTLPPELTQGAPDEYINDF
jgi:hypothetical protein